ncbi:MAG TPA: MerR family transcriptional regulator [Candidatus Deferrimicrobiaceae bacterium]|nr:MerR family transcriptional regulator [Candidatus Deferrimicrobiaceae bacterium]
MAVPEIPDKFYFKIGEVSSLLGVKPYVVRFWETEFDLAPAKNRSRHRVYKKHEVETLLEIRRLLYDERFTIEGAQKKLKERMKDKSKQLGLNLEEKKQRAVLQKVKKDLEKIREMLRQ